MIVGIGGLVTIVILRAITLNEDVGDLLIAVLIIFGLILVGGLALLAFNRLRD